MRTKRNAAVLAVSLGAHALLLTAWLLTAPRPVFVEPPAIDVQLVRPPSKPRPAEEAPKTTPPPRSNLRLPAPLEPPPPPQVVPPVAPRPLTDQELVAGPRPTARELRDAPISSSGSWDRPPRPPRPKCKPAEGYPGPPLPCPGEIVKDPNRPFDVDRDAPDSDLARAGRYKRAMKRYHEMPGGAGYPGIRCAIFHEC